MKYYILSAIMAMTIGVLNAQVITSVSQKNLSASEKNLLDKHFKKYKTFSIDKKEVLDSLKNYGKFDKSVSLYVQKISSPEINAGPLG